MSHTRTNHVSFPTDRKPSRKTRIHSDCGKVVHASRSAAKAAVKSMRSHGKGDVPGKVLAEYRCRDCGCWHIGHTRI